MALELNDEIYKMTSTDLKMVNDLFTERRIGDGKTVKECVLTFHPSQGIHSEFNKKTIFKTGGLKPAVCTVTINESVGEQKLRYYTHKTTDNKSNPVYRVDGNTGIWFNNPDGKNFQLVIREGQKEFLFYMIKAGWLCVNQEEFKARKHFLIVKNDEALLAKKLDSEKIYAEVGNLILSHMSDDEVLNVGLRLGIQGLPLQTPNFRRNTLKNFYIGDINKANMIKLELNKYKGIKEPVRIPDAKDENTEGNTSESNAVITGLTESDIRAIITKAQDTRKLYFAPNDRTWTINKSWDVKKEASLQDKTQRQRMFSCGVGEEKYVALINFLIRNHDWLKEVQSLIPQE